MDKLAKGSWKTTVAGIMALVIAVATAISLLVDGDPETMPDWNVVAEAAIGLGLLFARDNNKSSESVGAK